MYIDSIVVIVTGVDIDNGCSRRCEQWGMRLHHGYSTSSSKRRRR